MIERTLLIKPSSESEKSKKNFQLFKKVVNLHS